MPAFILEKNHICVSDAARSVLISRKYHPSSAPQDLDANWNLTQPFSDSSSLARHCRIHSGKRPYKRPYANCQRTFTRRTTLTRHQNHHTGTVEEAERAVGAALANRISANSSLYSNLNGYSGNDSVNGTLFPVTRAMSMSPGSSLPPP